MANFLLEPQSLTYGPSVSDALSDGVGPHSDNLCPLHRHQASVSVGDAPMSASIASLFNSRCPLAIGWIVASVIVNSLKSVAVGLRTHVCIKALERLSPLRTNGDPPACIIFARRIVRVLASLNHSCPDIVFRTVFHGVCSATSVKTLLVKTAARLSVPRQKFEATNKLYVSAFALTG